MTSTEAPRHRTRDTSAATLSRRIRKWERWAEEMRKEGGYTVTGGRAEAKDEKGTE